MTSFIVAAQVSTSHMPPDVLTVDLIRRKLREAQQIVPFPIQITGAREMPAIFEELTGPNTRTANEVYIWYNLLSGYPGQTPEESVVNYRGEPCRGWNEWEEDEQTQVEETFIFACPNHPSTRSKTLAGLEHLLKTYSFDGVFLDKFRFPSPANGLDMVYSCFCPYCLEKAKERDLDLNQVRLLLSNELKVKSISESAGDKLSSWLDTITARYPLLQQFIQFRKDSIYELTLEVRKLVDRYQKKLALDLFTPLLAPLVGQDYSTLVDLGDWFKPMVYRKAYGPAGFRLEVESLIKNITEMYQVPIESILEWAKQVYPAVDQGNYHQMVKSTANLEWMDYEISQAIELFTPKPVLMGLETVNFPGVIEITPQMINDMVSIGLKDGVQGAVISWDLLNTPIENIQAIKDSL